MYFGQITTGDKDFSESRNSFLGVGKLPLHCARTMKDDRRKVLPQKCPPK